MALTPELNALRQKLTALGYANRSDGQDRMLLELEALNDWLGLESLREGNFASVTKMTSPGDGSCSCCGR